MKKEISYLLLAWYQDHKRMMPWRVKKEPYYVWISEIMLQQTRTKAVIPYYERFIKNIPDIITLANIPLDELLKLWEGLGYYHRAKNLKKAAQIIVNDYNASFPSTYDEIIKLPGIGEYTASAIASICFHEATPVIDGNVLRITARLTEDKRIIDLPATKKSIRNELRQIMPLEAGEFNEAIMELGEVICLPKGVPKCGECPLSSICMAYLHQSWAKFPVKEEKKKKKELFFTVFLFHFHDRYALNKRKDGQLLSHLWEFPNIEGNLSLEEVKKWLKEHHIEFVLLKESIASKHVFTHQIWHMKAYDIELSHELDSFSWATLLEMEANYAIPSAFKPFLENIKNK